MKSFKYIEIGQRLKELRGNYSQKAFAKKIGISHIAYQNYELGKRVPPGATLSNISKLCDITVDWILTGYKDVEDARAEEHKKRYSITSRLVNALEESVAKEESTMYLATKARYEDKGLETPDFLKDEKSFIESLHNWLDIEEGDTEIDNVSRKILTLLKDMDEGDRREVLKHVAEKKLLKELLEERNKKQAGEEN